MVGTLSPKFQGRRPAPVGLESLGRAGKKAGEVQKRREGKASADEGTERGHQREERSPRRRGEGKEG